MGNEIDLLVNYPKPKRDLNARAEAKTERDREIAREFGKEFFDGDRRHGYGGFTYHPRFWGPVVPTFIKHWNMTSHHSLLDVGCAKGFMLHDFSEALPGLSVAGIDVSTYAIDNAIESMGENLSVADAVALPFEDDSFDFVVSINTIHNLEKNECFTALREIERVSRVGSFVTVDAYNSDEEKKRMYAWNLTAKTIMSTEDWVRFFAEAGYSGDYFWFIP